MAESQESSPTMSRHHEQVLRLVTKSFYNELINYGVNRAAVLSVAGHLLDNVMHQSSAKNNGAESYNKLFTLKDIQDEWAAARRLTVQGVSLWPMCAEVVPQVAVWLRVPTVQESFYPKFPDSAAELEPYFKASSRQYFAISYQDNLAGFIGAENIDPELAKLEMRKLVGEPEMRGKGIGKRATFLFLYYVFAIRKYNKVYIHSLDTNIRNLNLNAKFGFELEGVFLEDALVRNRRKDVVRMALAAPAWLKLFS